MEKCAAYPGWDFHAQCYHDGSQFCAEVRVNGRVDRTLKGDTPRKIMDEATAIYGVGIWERIFRR